MGFLRTIAETEASGEIAEIYRTERQRLGYLMDCTRAMTTRQDVLPAFERFLRILRDGFTLPRRDWKLITLVAAKQIRSTYCSLVYGAALVKDLGSPEAVLAVERDFRAAGLSARDVAMLEYAEKVSAAAHEIETGDIQRLRDVGFSDEQIFDIAMCASARNMISRIYDAVGAGPDPEVLGALESPELREALVVGRRPR